MCRIYIHVGDVILGQFREDMSGYVQTAPHTHSNSYDNNSTIGLFLHSTTGQPDFGNLPELKFGSNELFCHN